MKYRTVREMNFKNKRVLIRADFNVPINEKGEIESINRINEVIPTIKYILDKGCKQIILMSHLGNPNGKVDDRLKMNKIASKLTELLKLDVIKVDDCIDIKLPKLKVILLENLRFNKGEELNDEEFAKKLSTYGDVYVNDAFGTLHREHASITVINKFLPGCIGFLVEKELKYLSIENMKKPILFIMGGSKINTKFPLIKKLINKVDYILIGGALIFTFYKALNYHIFGNYYNKDFISEAKDLLNNKKIILAEDMIVAKNKNDRKIFCVKADEIPRGYIGFDIGNESINNFKKYLKKASTIVWCGPLGYFEDDEFAKGTNEIADFLIKLNKNVIICGGDTENALKLYKNKFTYVSTGGGASIELLSGKDLPGLRALMENNLKLQN